MTFNPTVTHPLFRVYVMCLDKYFPKYESKGKKMIL